MSYAEEFYNNFFEVMDGENGYVHYRHEGITTNNISYLFAYFLRDGDPFEIVIDRYLDYIRGLEGVEIDHSALYAYNHDFETLLLEAP